MAVVSTDFATAIDDHEGTELSTSSGATLRLCRVLRPAANNASLRTPNVVGEVSSIWQRPDGTGTRGSFALVAPEPMPDISAQSSSFGTALAVSAFDRAPRRTPTPPRWARARSGSSAPTV
jgi:hypothetical protein